MIEVICDTCRGKFRVKEDAKNPVKCKICQSSCDVPQLRQRDKAAVKKGPKCPACGKPLAAGAKFCAACGTSTIDAATVHIAGWEADRALEKRQGFNRLMVWLFGWWR